MYLLYKNNVICLYYYQLYDKTLLLLMFINISLNLLKYFE